MKVSQVIATKPDAVLTVKCGMLNVLKVKPSLIFRFGDLDVQKDGITVLVPWAIYKKIEKGV